MILTIDIGNSRVKWVLFNKHELQEYGAFEYSIDDFKERMHKAGMFVEVDMVAVSNVAGERIQDKLVEVMKECNVGRYLFIKTQSKALGVTNAYKEYTKLGVDRWLGMIAAFNAGESLSGKGTCIIDCGTAITLDVVNSAGIHQGGVIAPGYKLMNSVLNQSTKNIEENLAPKKVSGFELGLTTTEAVRQGCAQMIKGGISKLLDHLSKKEAGKMQFFITGGDGEWVNEMIENKASYDPFLVNRGLVLMAIEAMERS